MAYEEMMSDIPRRRILWELLKARLRYPSIRNKVGELLPNVCFGLTNHPLGLQGDGINALSGSRVSGTGWALPGSQVGMR